MRTMRMAVVGVSVCALMAATLPQVLAAEEEEAGNNLSVPVLWSESAYPPAFSEAVTERFEGVVEDGYVVSQDETSDPCQGAIQKDPNNIWRADTMLAEGGAIATVDWGDSIEARDPNLNRAFTRVEMGLYANVDESMTGYDMCWIEGRGQSEVWGAQVTGGAMNRMPVTNESMEAMVYTAGARLTIQRIVPDRTYSWNPSTSQWQGSGADAPYFNSAVHEAPAEGPGTFGAEVTVSGKLSYGYLWDAKSMPQGEYRLTFSLDGAKGDFPGSGTNMTNAVVKPREEGEVVATAAMDEISVAAEEEGSGNTAEMRGDLNLTYIDVTVGTRTDPIPPLEPVNPPTPPIDGGVTGGGSVSGGDVSSPATPASPGANEEPGTGENPVVGPASPIGLVPQKATIRAKKAGTYKVGQRLLLAAKPVKTDAGVTVRWRVLAQDRLECTVRVRDGRATVLLKKPGTCTVVGWAPAPSPQFERYQWTRTYRIVKQ